MFCYQCEQAADGTGCALRSVCGKSPEVAALQDLLTYLLEGLGQVAVEGRRVGIVDGDLDAFTCKALFATLTNVNFDPERFVDYIERCIALREALKGKVRAAGGPAEFPEGPACAAPTGGPADLAAQGEALQLFTRKEEEDVDAFSLKSLLVFGLRGVASYADHAHILGKQDDAVYAFIHEGLAAVQANLAVTELLALVLKCGQINLRTMELLDAAHTGAYGHPVPTRVPLGAKRGKAILISGHDLRDLDALLQQTEGKGINVYTHGEMLPAHGYPGLKKHPHLYGHYGGAWQDQVLEFPKFPGAILMTTNCLQKPRESYRENIFTCGTVGWPGVRHIADRDFTPVIEKALAMAGYPEDVPGKTVTTGFARNAVLGVADKVVEAVKTGAIRHFFLVGVCDGADPGRNY
ncbi:MAG: hydroxylamine reductase, partial [Candidatus Hydrogenedentes bacterium]|nr:hydroxylamine reductase [Candidatus Hydrogenedentota bacterium]